jgi:hypothetical protein
MPCPLDQIEFVQVTQHLRHPRLRDTGLCRERSSPAFLIRIVTGGHERADDRETARTARQRPALRWGRGGRSSLAEQEPWRSHVEVPPVVRPRPVSSRQDRPEGFGDERSDQQWAAQPGQLAP